MDNTVHVFIDHDERLENIVGKFDFAPTQKAELAKKMLSEGRAFITPAYVKKEDGTTELISLNLVFGSPTNPNQKITEVVQHADHYKKS